MKTFKQFITEEDEDMSDMFDTMADMFSDKTRWAYLTQAIHGPGEGYIDADEPQYSENGAIAVPKNALLKMPGMYATPADSDHITNYFFTNKELADLWMEYKKLQFNDPNFPAFQEKPQIKAIRKIIYDQ